MMMRKFCIFVFLASTTLCAYTSGLAASNGDVWAAAAFLILAGVSAKIAWGIIYDE